MKTTKHAPDYLSKCAMREVPEATLVVSPLIGPTICNLLGRAESEVIGSQHCFEDGLRVLNDLRRNHGVCIRILLDRIQVIKLSSSKQTERIESMRARILEIA